MINAEVVKNWPFAPERRVYTEADSRRFAAGFGAGLPGSMREADARFLGDPPQALPMMAVALADGEFWQQRPETGIDWRRIVHAAESITLHRPLPAAGDVVLTQRVKALYDRGAGRGAAMVQEQSFTDPDGNALVTIEVTTVLKGDGGFGGEPDPTPRVRVVPEDRAADAVVELATPRGPDTLFRISPELNVASQGATAGSAMLRGVGCFGLAGRAALLLACGNDPARLRRFGVRYAGPMFTDETMRVELWHLGEGRAALRMSAVERGVPVLDQCVVEFD